MAEAIDLEKLNLGELKSLAKDIQKAIGKRQSDNLKKARDAAEAAAREYGYSLDEIMGLKASKAVTGAADAKYRNPLDPHQSWSGRGRQPQWFKDAISAGRSPDELAA